MNWMFWKKASLPEYSSISDQRLIDLWVNKNDKGACAEISSRYVDIIFKAAAARLKGKLMDCDIAHDAVQHVMLTLVETPHVFTGVKNLPAYFIIIANNYIKKEYKIFISSSDLVDLDFKVETSSNLDLEENLIFKQNKSILDKFVNELDGEVRQIMRCYFLGYKTKALSYIFNREPKDINNLLYKVQEKLKVKIIEYLKAKEVKIN